MSSPMAGDGFLGDEFVEDRIVGMSLHRVDIDRVEKLLSRLWEEMVGHWPDTMKQCCAYQN